MDTPKRVTKPFRLGYAFSGPLLHFRVCRSEPLETARRGWLLARNCRAHGRFLLAVLALATPEPASYYSPECRDGSALDLRPGDTTLP